MAEAERALGAGAGAAPGARSQAAPGMLGARPLDADHRAGPLPGAPTLAGSAAGGQGGARAGERRARARSHGARRATRALLPALQPQLPEAQVIASRLRGPSRPGHVVAT